MAKQIIANGYAYEVNGTVYFDVEKYASQHDYGVLTNRKLEDMIANSRELDGQDEKRGRLDFALWIKAKPEHLMRWQSPWGEGFPGWHIECSAMSKKYLGDTFDIHGGGMDLAATHHTNEIAQSHGCNHTNPVKYWMHTNMLTVNGARMSKSAGNGFLPNELFTGSHPLLEKAYSPMCVRFFMMQTHYRSTLDFSNDALKAAEKGYARLMNAIKTLQSLTASNENTVDINTIINSCYEAMNDDFNTPIALASLFDAVRIINSVNDGKEMMNAENLDKLKKLMQDFVFEVFGLKDESEQSSNDELPDHLMNLILDIRATVKAEKNYSMADKIRDGLKAVNIQIKDSKEGSTWEVVKQ
jgi:cysteinyl-tRNA synthetase